MYLLLCFTSLLPISGIFRLSYVPVVNPERDLKPTEMFELLQRKGVPSTELALGLLLQLVNV